MIHNVRVVEYSFDVCKNHQEKAKANLGKDRQVCSPDLRHVNSDRNKDHEQTEDLSEDQENPDELTSVVGHDWCVVLAV